MPKTPFVRDVDDYHRDLDILTAHIQDHARILMNATGKSYDYCLEYVKKQLAPGGRFELKDPRLKFIGRDDVGDREFKVTTFLSYVNGTQKNNLVLVPTMTTYLPAEQKRSFAAIYAEEKIALRDIHKEEMFSAKKARNVALATYKKNQQNNDKTKNNGYSGATVTKSTPLYHPTIHPTLSTICRCASGFGNTNNEKLISGNRHYWAVDVILANIATVPRLSQLPLLEKVLQKYNLVIPTVDDVLNCIYRSAEQYIRSIRNESIIKTVVNGMSDLDRAAFLYVGDMYQLRLLNDGFMREFMGKFITTPDGDESKAMHYYQSTTDEMHVLAALLCGERLVKYDIKDVDKMDEDLRKSVSGTLQNIYDVTWEYEDFIRAIFTTDNMPASMGSLPHMLRHNAVTSDTDSTIYTVYEWLEWWNADYPDDHDAVKIGHVVSYFSTATIVHILALMSTHMGVEKSKTFLYQMKSEFWFPVFIITSRAKTYFAIRGAEEGRVLEEKSIEVKGKVLRAGEAPEYIRKDVKNMLREILFTVYEGKQLDLTYWLKHVAKKEKELLDRLESGDTAFFNTGELKEAGSYKKGPHQSPYYHYLFWQEVFADKYGPAPTPPYMVIKTNISKTTKSKFNAWLNQIDDPALKDRLIACMAKYGKTQIGSVYIPLNLAESNGIPKEIVRGIDARSIVSTIVEPYYVLLESMGDYWRDSHQSRLISDDVIVTE